MRSASPSEASPSEASSITHDSISSRTSSKVDLPQLGEIDSFTQKPQQTNPEVRSICCIGAGYVGGPTAAVIALQNPHIRVTVVDKDCARIAKWNSRHLPVHEPGLYDVVRATRDGAQVKVTESASKPSCDARELTRAPNLFFTTNIEQSVSEADLIFLSVNTPTKVTGIGAGKATNMAAFESATRMVAQYASAGTIIVEKSTVPVRTAQMIRDIFMMCRPDESFEILSNPEFLAEGTAIKDLLNPDRVLIGSMPTVTGRMAAAALADVYGAWVDPAKIVTTNVWSSELTKLAANAMLAQRISSINSISAICEQVGADVYEVSRAVGLDKRIGSQFLKPGIGFGGSCFKKDILSLTYLARSLDLPEIAEYWEQVLILNDFQRDRFVHRVLHKLNGTLTGKKVAILGYAFKKDTNDSRESPAIDVVKQLMIEAPREIAIFDPQCSSKQIQRELDPICKQHSLQTQFGNPVQAYDDAYAALKDATATLILTDWDQFRFKPEVGITPDARADEDATCLSSSQTSELQLSQIIDEQATATDAAASSSPFGLQVEPPCPADCVECMRNTTDNAGVRSSLDWHMVSGLMCQPRWVFDGRGVVDPEGLEDLGFRVESIGRMSSRSINNCMVRPGVSRVHSADSVR